MSYKQPRPVISEPRPVIRTKRGPKPRVRRRTRRGRAPWYVLVVDGHEHYLGTDGREAHRRAGSLLGPERRPAARTVLDAVVQAIAGGVDRWRLQRFGDWLDGQGDVACSEWRPEMLQAFADSMTGLKPRTVRRYLYEASKLLKSAGLEPGRATTAKPTPAARDVPPEAVASALKRMRACGPILRFILATGCRPSEACRLEWSDIRGDTATLRGHKTAHHGRVRTLYLTPAAMEVLAAMPDPHSGTVFRGRDGQQFTANALRCALHRCGISGAYALRHTAAQSWLDQGIPMEDVAALLGHSDLRTVQVYAQVRSRRSAAVAARIKPVV
jgi:integrase